MTIADSLVDDRVSAVVDMLRVRDRLTRQDLAEKSGVPLRTLSRRLAGAGGWEARELTRLAEALSVPVWMLLEGPDALLAHAIPQAYAPRHDGVHEDVELQNRTLLMAA